MGLIGIVSATVVASGLGAARTIAQSVSQVEAHVAAAKMAAGTEFAGVFNRVCTEAVPPSTPPAPRPAAQPRPSGPPPRESWHADPVNSVWAVTTSAGIILIDSIFDYSVDDEVAGGLKKLGLDPAAIKYVIISHGHSDHSGGAKYLQDRFDAHVLLSAADWDLLDKSTQTRPRRDMVASDGQKLTLGNTTITIYQTPGHTLGTLSTVIPVTDNGTPHVAVSWGGTAFNWMANRAAYITPERPVRFWFETYSASARRFKDIAAKAGADVLISNHTIFDGSKEKIPALARRTPGDPNPYVIGTAGVQRYLTVVDECAQAGLAGAQ
jgi:metallo-beta-lactamase class B